MCRRLVNAQGGRLLIVSREMAPSVGPHPIRVSKLAKYLPEFGWHPTILTVPVDHAWALDLSMLEELGAVPVIRIPRLLSRLVPPPGPNARTAAQGTDKPQEAHRLRARLRRITSGLLIPDRDLLWALPAARRTLREARSFDVILTTGPPFSTHLVGAWVTQRTGIPWVAEYRDNWTMNPLYRRAAPRRQVERRIESWMLRRAAAAITVSEAAAAEMVATFPGIADRMHVAMNGFDPDDMPLPQPIPSEFEIAYAGTLDERRDPRIFIGALERQMGVDAAFAARLRLRLMGNIVGWVSDLARSRLGKERVLVDGQLPHRLALERAAEAAVLLGITTRAESGGTGFTSKLFEYLGLRRPVLMLAPPGPARELVEQLQAGAVADPDDLGAIVNGIRTLYEDWRSGRQRVASDGALASYTRRETARRVAIALEAARARGPVR